MIEMKVKGLKKFNQQCLALGRIDLSKGVLKAAIRVERTAKEIVPVDTGTLKRSITHLQEGNRAIVGTSIEYAAKVELGLGQRRQPYLTPALLENKDKIKSDILREIRKQADIIAGG